jgi:Fur family transcriptional regulator, ferric uptake regulator
MKQTAEPRLAKNHRLVYDIVSNQGHGTHLAMTDIHELALARRPGIGFTTVYRALSRLRDAGLVSEILLPGADAAYYEPAGEAHAHFRCSTCGRIEDVAFTLTPEVTENLATRHNVAVDSAQVILHGRCANCR